jgi:hypothetical protein
MGFRSYWFAPRPTSRRTHRRAIRFTVVRRLVRSLRRALRAVWSVPPAVRALVAVVVILAAWFASNWVYQTIRKPTEVFFPVSDVLSKTPVETWRRYGPLFKKHSTAVITPELLAALAQVEGGGNPLAQTYWRWNPAWNPFELYQPASSAVGMFQITDSAFREAKRYCIRNHVVIEDGPWHDMKSCWFNSFYTRVLPSHAIELTAAMLDRGVASVTQRHRITALSLQQRQNLAAVIHLCGAGQGHAYARRGFRLIAGEQCGDHDVRVYLVQVNAMKQQFGKLAAAEEKRTRSPRLSSTLSREPWCIAA